MSHSGYYFITSSGIYDDPWFISDPVVIHFQLNFPFPSSCLMGTVHVLFCRCQVAYYKLIRIKRVNQLVKNTFCPALACIKSVRCERFDICCGQKEWPASWLGILIKPWGAADPILCSVLRVKHWARRA